MSFMNNVMGILTFNKSKIGALADDDGATLPAILIAFLASIVGSIPGLLDFLASNDPDLQEIALTAALTEFLTILLIYFLFSGIMAFVLRGFGGTATLIQCLRVFGFAEVWSFLGSLIDLALSLINTDFGFSFTMILGLIGLIAFIIGLTAFSGLGIGSAIIAVIIAYILAFILLFIILTIIMIALVAALLSAL